MLRVVFVSGILGVMLGFLFNVPMGISEGSNGTCSAVGVLTLERSDMHPLLLLVLDLTESCRNMEPRGFVHSNGVGVGVDSELRLLKTSVSECSGVRDEACGPENTTSSREMSCLSGLPSLPELSELTASVLAIEETEKLRACARVSRSSSTMSRMRLS